LGKRKHKGKHGKTNASTAMEWFLSRWSDNRVTASRAIRRARYRGSYARYCISQLNLKS